MNFILQLFKIAGAFAAVVLCIGFAAKSDFNFLEAAEVSGVSMASIEDASTAALDAYDRPVNVDRRRPGSSSFNTNLAESENISSRSVTPREVSSTTRRSKDRASMTTREIEDWIQLNVAQTYLEAEQETMSPGVILATGVYFLQSGTGDMSMTAADVAAYLKEVRQTAKSEAKARMKYIANSEQWFEGLRMAGFDGDRISQIFNSHQLEAYDKQMFNRHVERKIERTDYETADENLAADVEDRNRDLADAYNDYANRSDVRAKLSLPTRVEAEPLSVEEVSDSRREALSIGSGQSKTYDDPRIFWAVLKEMIALENDYPSWDAYQKDYPREADRSFQARSDIMATGGVMKVNRRKGA